MDGWMDFIAHNVHFTHQQWIVRAVQMYQYKYQRIHEAKNRYIGRIIKTRDVQGWLRTVQQETSSCFFSVQILSGMLLH